MMGIGEDGPEGMHPAPQGGIAQRVGPGLLTAPSGSDMFNRFMHYRSRFGFGGLGGGLGGGLMGRFAQQYADRARSSAGPAPQRANPIGQRIMY